MRTVAGATLAGLPAPPDVLAGELLAWYRRAARDLPWRRDVTPYRTWVSEAMLQQTQVSVVAPYFERFVARFPDVGALAAASLDEVLGLWSGLGYYRRARHLHEAARIVMERHGGQVPDAEDALLALPGVGRYMAGAIRSIAFGQDAAILDGNVIRVLARMGAFPGDPRKEPLARELWTLAHDLIPKGKSRNFNQALMELGATVCTPKGPRCPTCPWRDRCRARARGTPLAYPQAAARPGPRRSLVAAAVILDGDRLLLVRRPMGGFLAGLFDLPSIEIHPRDDPARAVLEHARASHGLELCVDAPAARVSHSVFDRSIQLVVCPARLAGPLPKGLDAIWIALREPLRVGVSTMAIKALRSLDRPVPPTRAAGVTPRWPGRRAPRSPAPRERGTARRCRGLARSG